MEPPTKPRLLIVSYSLPMTITENKFSIEWGFNAREFNSTLSAVKHLKQRNVISDHKWIGCLLKNVVDEQREEVDSLFEENCCHQVDLSSQIFNDFFHGFCKGVLWPLFHSQIKDVKSDDRLWKCYQQANEAFAAAIHSVYRPGDLIWVHGYHLMLVPKLIRERVPDAIIGWFLHASFPSFEIFRILPSRTRLLEGILGSTLVGFQTYTTATEFLQTCTRLLGQDANMKNITLESGHTCAVDVYPIGIDPSELQALLSTPSVQQHITEMRKAFAGKKIIIARDSLEKNNGILQKLQAVETLFTNYPDWHGSVVYLQICEPFSLNQETQTQLASDVNELVGRINGRFGRVGYVPVELYTRRIKREEMCALYRVADVALVTPLRAGMSTDVHEYVACRGSGEDNPEDIGVVVVSEFAGSARCFGGALIVNPYAKQEVASALNDALTMADDERALKHRHNWTYVSTHTSFVWAEAFLSDLEKSSKNADNDPVPKLNAEKVKVAYKLANKRLFLLDYDGTLTPLVKDPTKAVPSQRILTLLQKLASDENNYVYVISGRDRAVLEKWLGDIEIGLCCEHGSFICEAKSKNWVSTSALSDISSIEWRDPVLALMKYFEERTPGAVVETKHAGIAWHYRNADPQYSKFQAQELMSHLKSVSAKFPVDVLWGNRVIEARPSGVHKGGAVRKILADLCPDPDFILCVGDDKTDEDMFAVIDKSNSSYFSVVVKRKPTHAKSFVREPKDVLDLLAKLAEDCL